MCTELILFDFQKYCQLGGARVTKLTLADEGTKAWREWEEMGPQLHYPVRWTKQDLQISNLMVFLLHNTALLCTMIDRTGEVTE